VPGGRYYKYAKGQRTADEALAAAAGVALLGGPAEVYAGHESRSNNGPSAAGSNGPVAVICCHSSVNNLQNGSLPGVVRLAVRHCARDDHRPTSRLHVERPVYPHMVQWAS
jgi:hypothetical protein